ncbi:hypothetical protein ACWATR_00410 [Nostoc sp. UIC 10890]
MSIKKIVVLTFVVVTILFGVINAPAYAFVQSDLDKLISTKEAPNIDLSGADLELIRKVNVK